MSAKKTLHPLIIILYLSIGLTLSCMVFKLKTNNLTNAAKPLVTFIIPTIGRPSLQNTLQSLIDQHNPNWQAIIIFDGIAPQILTKDPRFISLHIAKTGLYNHAGAVRNHGMQYVQTEWTAFVDDDDILSPDYVDCLLEESQRMPTVQAVIFRMYHPEFERIIPAPTLKNLSPGDVGISFSIRTALYKAGFQFDPGPIEDFKLLELIQQAGHKMVLSPYVTYWVKGAQKGKTKINPQTHLRTYLN